jgi:hypothetical protein
MRQGMGIIVSREGGVLTSGSILADCRSGVVKTADGALHIIQKISRWDSLQDLALLQIEMIPSMEKAKLTPRRRLGYSQLRWQKNKCMKAGNYENRNLVNRSPEPIDHVSASSG